MQIPVSDKQDEDEGHDNEHDQPDGHGGVDTHEDDDSYLGNCFSMAWRVAHDEGKGLLVVHGLAVGRGPANNGKRFWHAWNETEDGMIAVDRSNGLKVLVGRDTYYHIGQIEEEMVWRYSLEEAAVLMLRQDSYGPWVEGWREMGL